MNLFFSERTKYIFRTKDFNPIEKRLIFEGRIKQVIQMSFISSKRRSPTCINDGKKCSVKANRFFQTMSICRLILNDILMNGEGILAKKAQFTKFIDESKLIEAQNFAKNACGSVIQNFFAEHQCLSPKMVYEQKPNCSTKSPHSFLNYDDDFEEAEKINGMIVKLQHRKKREDNNKVYNFNKVLVHKKRNTSQEEFSYKNSTLNQSGFDFSARFSHKNSMSKISIDHNVFVPRLTNRARLTVNPFSVSNRSSSKHTLIQTEILEPNPPSTFQTKPMLKIQKDHNKLMKLEVKKNNSDRKSFKSLEIQKETNNYITYLRDRKQKLENIMKDFDQDQVVKNKERNEREVLMKQSKTENLAETFSKFPMTTTDYKGNVIRVYEKKPFPQGSILNNNFQMKGSRYQPNNQAAFNNNVTYKIRDFVESTKNLINQIFSSLKVSPSKPLQKPFNDAQEAKKRKTKVEKKPGIKNSFIEEENKKQKSDQEFQQSIKSFESLKPKILIHQIQKPAKSILKHGQIKKSPENSIRNINKQNSLNSDIKKQKTFKTDKMHKTNSSMKIEQTTNEAKHNHSSVIQLGKLYREQYLIKKQRIHPQSLLKGKKHVKINSQNTKTIRQLSSENSQKSIGHHQTHNFKNVFDFLIFKSST